MQQILRFDRSLFRVINHDWSNAFFDGLMPWLRNSTVWIPLYLFLILLVLVNYKKNVWWWILFAACTAAITDFASSKLIKENIYRLRPCNNPDYASWIHVLVGYRPQSSSFTSSHATNHFGIAMFLFLTLKNKLGKWAGLFFLWAGSICFAQVYVGVHYPLDVAAGAVIGLLIGYLTGKLFTKSYGLA